MGFIQSHFYYSLFTKHKDGDILIVLIYVDDLLITSSNLSLIEHVRFDLQTRFKMKDLGELIYFLGIEFSRSKKRDSLVTKKICS